MGGWLGACGEKAVKWWRAGAAVMERGAVARYLGVLVLDNSVMRSGTSACTAVFCTGFSYDRECKEYYFTFHGFPRGKKNLPTTLATQSSTPCGQSSRYSSARRPIRLGKAVHVETDTLFAVPSIKTSSNRLGCLHEHLNVCRIRQICPRRSERN